MGVLLAFWGGGIKIDLPARNLIALTGVPGFGLRAYFAHAVALRASLRGGGACAPGPQWPSGRDTVRLSRGGATRRRAPIEGAKPAWRLNAKKERRVALALVLFRSRCRPSGFALRGRVCLYRSRTHRPSACPARARPYQAGASMARWEIYCESVVWRRAAPASGHCGRKALSGA